MDSSSKSLLDLLNKSSAASKKSSDKDQLLALFGQKPVQQTAVSSTQPASPSNRNGNANDLLAALMGSTTPKQSNADSSAALLSSLMGSAKSAYSNNGSVQSDVNYLNPRHEDVLRSTSAEPRAQETPSKPETKAFFDNSNPFDDLERFQAAQTRSQSAKASPIAATRKSTSPQPMAVTQIEQGLRRATEPAPLASTSAAARSSASQSGTQTLNSQPKASSVAPAVKPASNGTSISLPSDHSSILKLAGSKLSSISLPELSPITKMIIKPDPLNRNIIAASYRYIAYPVAKDGNTGHIRIVDQDTGDTTLLTEHTSKVVSIAFATKADADGKNAFISVDYDSNVLVWSINSTSQIEKIFEIAGPSDGSHKARTTWNENGTYFGVSLTSRLYIFDYRSLVASPRSSRAKLNPDMRQALCVCKGDKAIRGFAFSPDSTAVSAIDKAGNIKFWILESSGRNMSASATIVLAEKNLSSIQFVSQHHVVVTSSASASITLVDVAAGKAAQELRLPPQESKDGVAANIKGIFNYRTETLVVQEAALKKLYLISLALPAKTETKSSAIVSGLSSTEASHLEASGHFKVISEFTSSDDSIGDWLDVNSTTDADGTAVLLAHTKGYTMSSISNKLLGQSISEAQRLDSSLVTKMPSLGRVVIDEEPAAEEVSKAPAIAAEAERPSLATPKHAKKMTRANDQSSSPSLVTEPRTAEMAARIEANLRTSITAELQKGNASLTSQIEKMQKASDSKHETVLRLISETLSKNTTQVLQSAISDAVEKSVLPAISKSVNSTVASHLERSLPSLLETAMAGPLASALHGAVQKAFDSAGLVAQLETAASTMHNDLGARHKHMEQSLAGALVRLDAQILERQKADSDKIEKLLAVVTALERQVADLKVTREVSEPSRALPHPAVPFNLPAPSFQAAQAAPPPQQQQPAAPAEDYSKYHELIMNFVGKSQKISAGDFEGVPFVRQFLSWQPERRVKDNICKSLAIDQLQILAFVHALASELGTEDAYNRVHWIASAIGTLRLSQDTRLATLGPQLMSVIHANLAKALERAPVGSDFHRLVESVLNQMASIR